MSSQCIHNIFVAIYIHGTLVHKREYLVTFVQSSAEIVPSLFVFCMSVVVRWGRRCWHNIHVKYILDILFTGSLVSILPQLFFFASHIPLKKRKLSLQERRKFKIFKMIFDINKRTLYFLNYDAASNLQTKIYDFIGYKEVCSVRSPKQFWYLLLFVFRYFRKRKPGYYYNNLIPVV